MSTTHEAMQDGLNKRSWLKGRSLYDWLFALAALAGAFFAYSRYAGLMDAYEVGILFGTGIALIALGWGWRPTRTYAFAVAALSLLAVTIYGTDLGAGESKFFLKYMLASQSAVMWMSALFVLATATGFGNYLPARIGTIARAHYLKSVHGLRYARFGSIQGIRTVQMVVATGLTGIAGTLGVAASGGRLSLELLAVFAVLCCLPVLA